MPEPRVHRDLHVVNTVVANWTKADGDKDLFVIPKGCIILNAQVHVTTALDGTSPTLGLVKKGTANALLPTADVGVAVGIKNTTLANVHSDFRGILAADTTVTADYTAGAGSTAGAATFIVTYANAVDA